MYETNTVKVEVGTKVYLPESKVKGTVTNVGEWEASVSTEEGNTVTERLSRLGLFPEVGMPVTYGSFISYPGTIVKVNAKGTTIHVRPDKHKAIGGEWPDVEYGYFPDYEAPTIEFRLNKAGNWKRLKDDYSSACIGRRVYYCNPSI